MADFPVRAAFDRAAASYDSVASLQRRVCRLLLDELPDQDPGIIVDAGCGTGHALRLFRDRWPGARVLAVDFSAAMLATAGGGICADVEALPFANDRAGLYWSSLTLQWCNPGRAVAEAARVLAPGGRLAVSSLGPGTLAELRAAFAGIDSHRHVIEFAPAGVLAEACARAGLSSVNIRCRREQLHHADLRSLMLALKALGASEVGPQRRRGLLGRAAWARLQERYERHRMPEGLPASYEVILCTAAKPIS